MTPPRMMEQALRATLREKFYRKETYFREEMQRERDDIRNEKKSSQRNATGSKRRLLH